MTIVVEHMETPLPSIPLHTPLPASAAAAVIPAAVKPAGTCTQAVERSPRAPANDAGGTAEALPAIPGAKLRLMCSYGGHIMPRPHDKALTYVGGETRLVVVDRHSSLSSFRSRLSRMLLNGRPFTLKYQLPHEDLDSLVSITTDEDLENMIEEYDRVTSSPAAATAGSSASQRIRLFLFANKLETAATMGSLLDGAKSETWFVDALNQSGLLPRGLSDSAAVDNCLLNLDDASAGEPAEMQTLETTVGGGDHNKQVDLVPTGAIHHHHEIHLSSMPDSPMLETASSSFGSSSSTPSMANLPPIRVRVSEEQRIEEQFAQMDLSNVHQRHLDDGVNLVVARPPVIPPAAINHAVPDSSGGGSCQVPSDDERSDPIQPSGYRKPPLPLQQVAVPPRTCGGYGLPSPDSVASDSSISSATSFSKPMHYHEQAQATPRVPGTQPEPAPVQTSQVPVHPVTYAPVDQHPQPQVQQPYVHHGVQYIPHPSQYIPVYPPHQQQNYPVYVMSIPQSQPYVPAGTPPLYPNAKPATTPKPEAAQNVYRGAVPQNPQVLQLQQQQPQPQPQYLGYSAVPHHATNANANYSGYDYSNAPSEPTYYHPQPPIAGAASAAPIPLASQYQSMTPAAAAAALADASKHNIAASASQPL